MARPRGDEWLADEMGHLKKMGVDIIVSLLEPDEIRELGLSQQEEYCRTPGFQYLNYPVPDRGIPKSLEKTRALITSLQHSLGNGKTVVIHCRMGIGRSSIIAGCLLLGLGYQSNDLIRHITKARGLSVPDTPAQITWLKQWKP